MYIIALLITCVLGASAHPVLLPVLFAMAESLNTPMFLLSLAVGAFVTYHVAMVAVLALMVGCTRGWAALGYAPRQECQTLSRWMWDSWYYPSSKGRQEGFRFFGLEVAVKGQIV